MKLEDFIKNNKDAVSEEQMSSKADANFDSLLKHKLHQPRKKKVVYLKYISVAASILLIFSLGFWFSNKENISSEEQELLANLDADSAGKRLEGVYAFNDEYQKEDTRIINRLIEILHKDENANVKIATIDGLLQFPKNEKIRKNLISALENEDKPLVQIKLIKALSILRENRAQKPLEKIINSKQTFPIVKNNATLAMVNIKQ
ncbi:HEAT repeat domain-containing protein [Polaribacter dokdonensis]|uniref:Anti-ECFsigma factor, ChrR n=1 Tax=Polaribacter dokdonensis DSW-5 TaxID=1300348 RepID=A0A0M9CH37_9FLAO|nr:HEAT repeat domain-containing protein [Polaribacter dokdonensis]KOY52353.1 Anti-ECFsigma factor, ChrR [Polaribacter dokdonensis DSW-5]SEE43931.1 HEAT repeat-containing protein [Polaribacter dokdonensis DSW-5]